MPGPKHASPPRSPPPAKIVSRRRALGLIGGAATLGFAPSALAQLAAPNAVATTMPVPRDASFDILHGVRIEDPFRPFEDPARPDVKAWIHTEDRAAEALLEGNPLHIRVSQFLRSANAYPRRSGMRRLGVQQVAWAYDGRKEQGWLEIAPVNATEAQWKPFLDPNAMAPDGSISLWGFTPDRLNQKAAYLTAENGGDAQSLRIRDLRTGTDLLDKLEGCRFTTVAWLPEGSAFYYVRPPLASESDTLDRQSHAIYLHQLGYPQSADRMIWRFPTRKNVFISLRATYPSNQLLVSATIGTDDKAGYWAGPLNDAALLTMLVPMGRSIFRPVRNNGAVHFAITDLDAPRRRIVRLIQGDPRPASWRTIVPESDGVIDGATVLGDRLLVRRFKDLGHKLSIHDLEGKPLTDVATEGTLRIEFERGDRLDNSLVLDIDDRRRPRRQARLDLATGALTPIESAKPPHALEDVEIRVTNARSKDGTLVPVTLMHRPGLKLDGDNRTLLYGYGSYGISQWPAYAPLAAAWIRLGGVYAVATIRGGSEFGTAWHENGRLAKKQNALDDFAAAAEHLVAERVTRVPRLGIYGASSGGRLVLGSLVQRPELFGAVVAGVPLVDMLRFPKHTFGGSWKAEYGDPEKPEDFQWLRALSPLHNIKAGVAYPPLLILTADNDQRVVPAHAYKFAATLREASPQSEVYVRTRKGAGHGGGNALTKAIAYQADIVTFLSMRLGGPLDELPKVAG